MSDKTCSACAQPATFSLCRSHDGGGRKFACPDHLAPLTVEVAAGLPSWASVSATSVLVTELP